MDKMLGVCGLVCSECPAFLATKNNDQNEKIRVAQMWSKEFGGDVKPEDINCDGCVSQSGRVYNHCLVCEIRKCGQDKHLQNCAYCGDYACQRLSDFIAHVPSAKALLDSIRNGVEPKW